MYHCSFKKEKGFFLLSVIFDLEKKIRKKNIEAPKMKVIYIVKIN